MLDLIKDALKEKEKLERKKQQQELEKRIEDVPPTINPDKAVFLAEQGLALVRETYVDQNDVVYQFCEKMADTFMQKRYNGESKFFKQGLAIGFYRGIKKLINKI